MKKVILTGGSDGLGCAFAKLCVAEGIEVVCLSRRAPDYACAHIPTDLADEASIKAAAEEVRSSHADFDAVVNCAGVISLQEPDKIAYDELERLFRVNVLAPIFLVSQLFELVKKNEADVLNVGSTAGLGGKNDHVVYGASKWAVRGISANLQADLAKTRCRVVSFNPGGMNTRMFEKSGRVPENLGEFMKPEDVAAVMLYVLKLPKQLEVSEIVINRKKG